MASKLSGDQERYLNYLRGKQNVNNLIGRIGKYRQDSYDEQVRDYERARQSAIRESMKNEQDDIRAEKQYRRYIDQKEKYDKAIKEQTARDMRGDDVRQEKQYKRYLDQLEEQRKQLDKQRQFDVSGNDVRQEKQYKRYLDALENQKKLQAKANQFAVSGDDVRQEKKFSRYLDQLAEQKKMLDADRQFAASGDDVRLEKKYNQYMDRQAELDQKRKDFMDYIGAVGKNEKELTRAESRYQSAVNSWDKLKEEQPEKADELKKAEDLKEWQEILAEMQQANRNSNNVLIGDMDQGTIHGGRPEAVSEAWLIGNIDKQRKEYEEAIENGEYDNTRDVSLWSAKKREAQKKQNLDDEMRIQSELDEIHRKLNGETGMVRLEDADVQKYREILMGDYSDEEKEEAQARLEELYQQSEGKDLDREALVTQEKNLTSQLRYIQAQNEQIDGFDRQAAKYDEVFGEYTPTDTKFHSDIESRYSFSGNTDVAYIYQLLEEKQMNGEHQIFGEKNYPEAYLMNRKETEVFTSYVNEGKMDEAWEFYSGLRPFLNQMYSKYEASMWEDAANRFPILSFFAARGANVLQIPQFVMSIPGYIEALATGKDNYSTDPYGKLSAESRIKNLIDNKISNNIGDFGWVYSGFASGVDSAINASIAQGLGLPEQVQFGDHIFKAQNTAMLSLFATQAFETSLQNVMAEGSNNFAYDFMEAFVDSVIETATEIWSVENFLAEPTNILTYIGKLAISEPSEEIAGAIIEPFIKEMIGHGNQYIQRADQIWHDGYYEDKDGNKVKVNSYEEAERKAMKEWVHDVHMAAASALVSVAPGGIYGAAKMTSENQKIGRQVQSTQYENGQTGLQSMLESAQEMEPGTKSYQQAQKISEKLQNEQQPSNYRVGQLARDMMREGQEQAELKAQDALRNEVRKELAGKEIRGSSAEEMTDLIMKAIDQGGIDNLSRKEREKIHDSSYGYNTYLKFVYASEQSSRAAAAMSEATKAEQKAMQSVSDALSNSKTKTQADDFVGKQLATEADIERTEGKRTGKANEVIVGRQFGKLEGMELTTDKEGKQEWKYKVTDGDGKTQLLDASEIKATNFSTAAAIRQQLDNPAVYSGDYFNHLMDHINTQQNTKIGNYLRDAENVRWAAFFGEDMPATGLSEKEAKEIYRISQNDLRSEWMKDQASRQENYLGKGNGRASFAGVEFGSEEWTKKLDDSGLTEDEKKTVNGLAALAVSSGIQFNFVDQINNNGMIHGSEAQDGITIALRSFDSKAEAEKNGRRHEIVVTVGHELTHWLRRNNASGYIELQNYVVQTMKDRGVNIHARAQEILDNRAKAGDVLTMSGAIEEMVANACDQVMASQEAADYLEKNNPGLYEKIRGYVKDLVGRIKAMFAEKSTWKSASRDSKYNLGLIGEQVNELNRIWWGKFDEVLSGQVKEMQAAPAEEKAAASKAENFSMAEEQKAYKGESLYKDSHVYDYDFMVSLPNIKVNTEGDITTFENKDGTFSRDILAQIGMENAIKYAQATRKGDAVSVVNDYTGRELLLTKRSFTHGTHNNDLSRDRANARVGMIAGQLAKNAIPINGLKNEKNIAGTYAMVAPVITADQKGVKVAVLTVEVRSGNVVGVELKDNVHAVSARKMNGVGISGANAPAGISATNGLTSTTRSDMSIADLLEIVNKTSKSILSDDVLKHFGETRPENGYWSDRALFSMAEDDAADVGVWMMGLTESSVHTEGERALIREYRGLRTSLDLCRKRQMEYREQIRNIQKKGMLSAEDRDMLTSLENKLQIQMDKQARLEQELYDVTRSEGYAGMMYRNSRIFDDYVNGKNQQQVEAAVDTLINEAERAEKSIEKRQKAIRKLADDAAVNTIRRELKSRGLSWAANGMKKNYYTAMSTGEIEGRLAEIVLRAVNNEDITADIESLANDMTTNGIGFGSEIAEEALSNVRGMTIEIGPGQQAEMKANHLTLKDIRERTKGSGVTFKYGPKSTLDINAEEIGNLVPELRESLANEKQSLGDFVDWIGRQLAAKKGNAQDFGVNPEEVAVVITACAQQMLNADQGGMSAEDLKKRIENAQGEIGKLAEAVDGLMESAKEIRRSAMKASNATGGLRADAVAAIDYYNMVAKQAAEVERNRVKRTVIDELRSENTKKLIEQQQKYQEMMKKDKRARDLQHDNEQLRKVITTDVKRLKDRLVAETDQKNVPEEAKPLARQLVSMLVDHDRAGWRHVLFSDKKTLTDVQMRLAKMEAAYGSFDMDADLDFLVIHAPNEEDSDYSMKDKVLEDLMHIEQGLLEYRNAEGQGVVSLADRKAALEKVQEAVTEIYDVIRARETAFVQGQKRNVMALATQMERDMADSRFKGERKGTGSGARNAAVRAVNYGNMTPEYFFKNLRNGTLQMLHKGLQDAEQNSGLQAKAAQEKIEKIAKEYGYATWDGQEKKTVTLSNGKQIRMSVEQLMALYATWNREKNQLRPEETSHLLKGGFVLAEDDAKEGKARREKSSLRPIRVNEDDLNSIGSYLTEKQRQYADAIVEYMSTDLAKIGNEASLRTYGIKKFTESYYFPTKSWGGVLNKSSASGISNQNENRAMQQSFSKRIRAGARNALEIGDFTATAMKHIIGMITFNTVGPAVENLNKVLNQQLDYYEDEEMDPDEAYKRNMRAAFQQNYGKAAYDYLTTFMQDVNGGVGRRMETSLKEKLLSVFRKGAVAGSLSVSLQQPLSYIRAAMEIDTKYLLGALSPTQWGRIHDEMTKYSGIAVIKDMGRFDMNQGQSMIEYITPEGKESKGKKAWEKFSELTTIGPEKMDAITWGRMWIACKLEQEAKNPGMDTKSDEFLEKVAERFNDVMRRTQVYDSVMVKSQNMRSKNYAIKAMTSFMAEPTLSLNVLADAVVNAQENGGKAKLAKAAATFLLSAAAQAAAKALMSSGRSPDKRKTWEEQFLTKWAAMFISEANPLGLIPGFSDLVEVLKNGELTDDAMGVLGKIQTIWQKSMNWISGKDTDTYRSIEDTFGQVAQLFTNVPLKNLMRDGRAMYNFFNPNTYAQRETSAAVLKYGILDAVHTQDNLTGVINKYMNLAGAGYFDTTSEYAKRTYEAQKRGDDQAAKDMTDYYVLAKSKANDPEKNLSTALNSMAKKDKSLSAEEKIAALEENGYKSTGTFILEQLKKGEIDRKSAEELYRKERPDADEKKIAETLDGAEWTRDGKALPDGQKNYTNYTPLIVAVGNNRSEEIRSAVEKLEKIGYTEKDIKTQLTKQFKQAYVDADEKERIRLRNAIQITYKEIGLTAEDADKIINGWTKEKKK